MRVGLGVVDRHCPDCANGKGTTEAGGPGNLRSGNCLEDKPYGGDHNMVDMFAGNAVDGILY